MSDIDMDLPSPAPSYKAYEELLLSRPSTPLTPEPISACGRRRAAMTRLKNQETMIDGYQKFLATFSKGKDEHGVYKQLQESLNETIEARDSLVKKRKNTKNNADDFVFPSKTARPITPTPVLQPIAVQNSFVDLVQDPDLPTDNTAEIPKIPPPLPVYLKLTITTEIN
ncbi:hypothetical protein TNCV_3227951 [Trichonephila clavipes]|nr:hypothetical protein TNCV_3227951 [Trichonephila clavipes]